jgi:hypothetical protein
MHVGCRSAPATFANGYTFELDVDRCRAICRNLCRKHYTRLPLVGVMAGVVLQNPSYSGNGCTSNVARDECIVRACERPPQSVHLTAYGDDREEFRASIQSQ